MNPDPSSPINPGSDAPIPPLEPTQPFPQSSTGLPMPPLSAPSSGNAYSKLISTSEDGQTFDPSAHKMIPVVEKPLDINQVSDTPAQQFNPFKAATSVTSSESKTHPRLNLILIILFITLAVAAVIFGILWRQAVEELNAISSSGQNIRVLTCSLQDTPQDTDSSMITTYTYQAIFNNRKFSSIANSVEFTFETVDEATLNYPYVEQQVDKYKELFASMSEEVDYDTEVDKLEFTTAQDSNKLILSIRTEASNLSNPFQAQFFGLNLADSNEEAPINPDTITIENLRDYYENNTNYICEITSR